MLSVIILSAFTVFGLIVLPALAEIRSKRSEEEDAPGSENESDDVLLAA
jgi:hypothetical protein